MMRQKKKNHHIKSVRLARYPSIYNIKRDTKKCRPDVLRIEEKKCIFVCTTQLLLLLIFFFGPC